MTQYIKMDDTPDPLADAPFLVLGIKNGNRYSFVRKDSGAERVFTAGQLYREANLCSLAPASFWEAFIASIGAVEGKSPWRTIGHYLQQVGERRQVSNQVRRMGVWEDADGIVVHCGNDLQRPDGEWTKPWLWTGGNYIRHDELAFPRYGRIATVDETRDLHEAICERWRWKVEASGYLVAGWAMLAPIANCLEWRPHIWINGSAGCGKTELVSFIHAISHFVYYRVGGTTTTPASIRHAVGKDDAFSCVIDELGPPWSKQERTRTFDGLMELIRKCSNGSSIVHAQGKGTVRYRMSAMFMCVSRAVSNVPDIRRFSVCEIDLPTDTGKYHQWRDNMNDAIDGGLPGRLLARTVQMLRNGTLARTIKEFRAVFVATSKFTRQADQLGTLMAGSWLMMNDDPPSASEAHELVMSLVGDESSDMHGPVTEHPADPQAEGRAVLNLLLQTPVVLGLTKEHISLGHIIMDVLSSDESVIDEHTKLLRQHFIRVREGRVLFGCDSRLLREALHDSMYVERWWQLLATIPGAQLPTSRKGGRISFAGVRTMCVSVPASVIQNEMSVQRQPR